MRPNREGGVSARSSFGRSQLKVEVALVELKGVRLILAFPDDSYVRPGAGDRLIEQLAPHLPPLGIMLVSEGTYLRAYAHFETHAFLEPLRQVEPNRFEVDLSAELDDEDEELPF